MTQFIVRRLNDNLEQVSLNLRKPVKGDSSFLSNTLPTSEKALLFGRLPGRFARLSFT